MSLGRRAASVALVLAFGLIVVAVRVVVESHVELARADAAATAGETTESIAHLGRAARWYAPGNGASSRAFERLAESGRAAEASGDRTNALRAWRELRGASLATRSTYTPHADLLEEANQHIATLMASTEQASVAPGQSESERRAFHLALLERDDAPKVGWTLLALAGLAGWILAAFAFIYRGFDDEDRLRGRAALLSGLAIVAGFAAFLVGLARA